MNKAELVKTLAEKTTLSQKDVASVIDVLPEVIKETVETGDKIALTGFITFEKAHIKERSGVSKMGGVEKPWTTPAHDEVKVSLSKKYRQF